MSYTMVSNQEHFQASKFAQVARVRARVRW